MNGISPIFLFLIWSFLSSAIVIGQKVTSADVEPSDYLPSMIPSTDGNLKQLMTLLRRHQRDEEDLKFHIKDLLVNFHVSSQNAKHNHNGHRKLNEHEKKTTESSNNVLHSNPNDPLEQMSITMSAFKSNHKSSKPGHKSNHKGSKPAKEKVILNLDQDKLSRASDGDDEAEGVEEVKSSKGYKGVDSEPGKNDITSLARQLERYMDTHDSQNNDAAENLQDDLDETDTNYIDTNGTDRYGTEDDLNTIKRFLINIRSNKRKGKRFGKKKIKMRIQNNPKQTNDAKNISIARPSNYPRDVENDEETI